MGEPKIRAVQLARAREAREDEVGDVRTCARLGAYLRRLREGYGYTLRKVEEHSLAYGEPIDNSQLSRFEKGKAVPSFDKLRSLARIFNVPVQNFADVLDVEQYEAFKPDSDDYDQLIRDGATWFARGEHGRAFVTFERAVEVAESTADSIEGGADRAAEARWRMASALKALGKLTMTEQELREILKRRHKVSAHTRVRTLLQLSYVYRELGDLYLASVLARECLEVAGENADRETQACVLNTLGNIHHDEGDFEKARVSYQAALETLDELGARQELRVTALTNLGGCLAALGRIDEGMALIRESHSCSKEQGYRRVAALSLTRLGEAFLLQGDRQMARQTFNESDAYASRPEEAYHDILFLNAYRRWEMARQDGNDTREKIAFGRLRHLRSMIERRFPEVESFDHFVESVRRQHVQSP